VSIDCLFKKNSGEKEEQRHVEEIDELVDRAEFHGRIDQSRTIQATPYMAENHQNYACTAQGVDPIDAILHFILAALAMAPCTRSRGEGVCDIVAPFPRSKLHFFAIHVKCRIAA
jgi:hypothetical protein